MYRKAHRSRWGIGDRAGVDGLGRAGAGGVAVSEAVGLDRAVYGTDVTCALIMGFTSLPTPDDAYIDAVKNQFIAPTHPGHIEYVAVTTPEEGWPLTGLIRLGCAAVGPPSLCGPGGAAWPDEPWWKLSGLFDLTYDQSKRIGVADLEAAMAEHGNDDLVIYGYSQGATIAIREKRKLAEQYPWGTKAPDIDFVLGGDLTLPNGGLEARFPGLYIPILDWSFDGPEPTDTQFHTDVVTRQYDGVADFPLYPLNVISLLNAVLGFFYVHLNAFDVTLPAEPTKSPAYRTHGDTDYYFFETQDLPLFGPLRTLGVPESLIDVFEPFFRVIVELGYDRSIPPWEPTPARLIPMHDPVTVAADLLDAIGEGINNAFALFGSPPRSIPAAPTEPGQAASKQQVTTTHQALSTEEATQPDGVRSMKEATQPDEATEEAAQPDEATEEAAQPDEVTSDRGAPKTVAPSESVKRPHSPATHRPVVRGPRGMFGHRDRDLRHRRDANAPATPVAAAGDRATNAGPSSVASSPAAPSPAGSNSSGGDSSGGDVDDS